MWSNLHCCFFRFYALKYSKKINLVTWFLVGWGFRINRLIKGDYESGIASLDHINFLCPRNYCNKIKWIRIHEKLNTLTKCSRIFNILATWFSNKCFFHNSGFGTEFFITFRVFPEQKCSHFELMDGCKNNNLLFTKKLYELNLNSPTNFHHFSAEIRAQNFTVPISPINRI